jgi:O-acetylhomoserine/O-acetylserine sulfhydrylase-like pyridoxal-dependent enzyme
MMALGLQPGDEVITATFTYVATAEVIALLQLKPVLVDVDPDTFLIDTEAIKKAITPKTKARYESAMGQLLPYLESQKSLSDLDSVVAEWVELQWSRGPPLATIGDCLCGLHFFWPEWRGLL